MNPEKSSRHVLDPNHVLSLSWSKISRKSGVNNWDQRVKSLFLFIFCVRWYASRNRRESFMFGLISEFFSLDWRDKRLRLPLWRKPPRIRKRTLATNCRSFYKEKARDALDADFLVSIDPCIVYKASFEKTRNTEYALLEGLYRRSGKRGTRKKKETGSETAPH